ncbi:MAG: hypothetical protein B6229_06900 [Spirochaetaceae bacterium 4572_7]|nr:MAG: hypothetical protein B6229_06900 [Spirochaetaceae bacterium 4572_7]
MLPPDYELTDEESKTFNSQILNSMIKKKMYTQNSMIKKKMYTQKLDELEIKSDEEAIDLQFNQMMMQYGSEEKMKEAIESKGFTVEELRNEEIRDFYDENKSTIFMKQPVVNLCRHILIEIEEGDSNAALEKIKEIREEIVGGMDFSDAAKKYSMGPSGEDGGKLPVFQKGEMVPEFETVAFALPLNEISGPVLTEFGYHLILVENRTDSTIAPFEETEKFIVSQLKRDQFFNEIEENANITKPKWAETEV